jgi:hypothetical protein
MRTGHARCFFENRGWLYQAVGSREGDQWVKIDASSGTVVRKRLNRGGNRQANSALWRIVMVRMVSDPDTRLYMERRTKEGLSKLEAIRCLKRHVAGELYPSSPQTPLDIDRSITCGPTRY